MMAQNQLIRECKVMLRKVQQSVSQITGEIEDKHLEEISAKLHNGDIGISSEVEQSLTNPEFKQAMITYMYKVKGASGSVNDVIRNLFESGGRTFICARAE
ncbi:PREDICTED: uncharacterized protein LOC108366442 [Rhagoletis zephyria]|uniref:uncharacterized protein LOC108366442 n=1 Tax=Rhagoletis zephyria TaxID=28612 RepID=UPI0008112C92|nr:PREDICTED: uncharacterized protein LOC108366442 [Rhagoletis zephyria]